MEVFSFLEEIGRDEMGRLSLGQAAELAGYSTRTFMELLGKLGVPVFDYPPEDLREETGS